MAPAAPPKTMARGTKRIPIAAVDEVEWKIPKRVKAAVPAAPMTMPPTIQRTTGWRQKARPRISSATSAAIGRSRE